MNKVAVEMYREFYEAAGVTGNSGYDVGSTEIWYMKPSFFRDGISGYDWLESKGMLPNPNNLRDTHVFLARINETNPDKIFGMMQGEEWSPQGEARDLIRRRGLAHTSMSVGDIIKTGSKAFMVSITGFKELPRVGAAREAGGGLSDSQLYGRIRNGLLSTAREISRKFPDAVLKYGGRELNGTVAGHTIKIFYDVYRASNGEVVGLSVIVLDGKRYDKFYRNVVDKLQELIGNPIAASENKKAAIEWVMPERVIEEAWNKWLIDVAPILENVLRSVRILKVNPKTPNAFYHYLQVEKDGRKFDIGLSEISSESKVRELEVFLRKFDKVVEAYKSLDDVTDPFHDAVYRAVKEYFGNGLGNHKAYTVIADWIGQSGRKLWSSDRATGINKEAVTKELVAVAKEIEAARDAFTVIQDLRAIEHVMVGMRQDVLHIPMERSDLEDVLRHIDSIEGQASEIEGTCRDRQRQLARAASEG